MDGSLSLRAPKTKIFGLQHVRLVKLHDFGITTRHLSGTEQHFITWECLKKELELNLLDKLFADPRGCGFTGPEEIDNDLAVIVSTPHGRYSYLWFGMNPHTKMSDGMVHVGGTGLPKVWQSYQRSWDGHYFRRIARFEFLEQARHLSGV